jgi:hypothetical protein
MPQDILYLDDARIGRFRPQARQPHQRFLEFVADAPSSRNVLDVLVHGAESLSSINVQHKRGLKAWRGVNHFRESIATEFANVSARDVYLAGRSRSLMHLGARMLSRSCHRMLSVAALDRHASCDWGVICDQDREANEEALIHGFRIMSVYQDSKNTKFWIITEADRSVTTVLLPEEY